MKIERVEGNFDLGIRAAAVRADGGPRPRAAARGLHASSLAAGLLAALAAAMALSTVAGAGVAAAGAGALSILSIFRSLFADAAATLSSAGSLERSLEATGALHDHGESISATPPALAPLFRLLASILPDGARFDHSGALVRNEVPDGGDALGAVVLGLGLVLVFTGIAALGARRRP